MSSIFGDRLRTAVIDAAASGNNTLIAAPSRGYIAVDHINILPTSAVSVTFKSGSTALTGPYPLDTKQPITLENALHHQDGVLTCAPGEALVMTLGGAVQVGGMIRYRIVGA
jgi:hypothetical protein